MPKRKKATDIVEEKTLPLPLNETKHFNNVKKDVDTVPPNLRPELKKFIIPVLRRATYRWKPRTEALRLARKERGRYECAICLNMFGNKEIDIDHVYPVVDLKTGFTDLNTYIDRMFPDVNGWQILCKTCHTIKTTEEDTMRAFYNKKRKELLNKNKK